MPRTGPRRPSVTIRISQQGVDFLDHWAERQDLSRSELVRRILASAINAEQRKWES